MFNSQSEEQSVPDNGEIKAKTLVNSAFYQTTCQLSIGAEKSTNFVELSWVKLGWILIKLEGLSLAGTLFNLTGTLCGKNKNQ